MKYKKLKAEKLKVLRQSKITYGTVNFSPVEDKQIIVRVADQVGGVVPAVTNWEFVIDKAMRF